MKQKQTLKPIIAELKKSGKIKFQKELAVIIGRNKSYISEMASGYSPVTQEVIELINKAYDTDFELENKENQTNELLTLTNDTRMVPVVNRYAYASFVDNWNDPVWLDYQNKIATNCPEDGNYFWFEVRGDSMSYDGRGSIEEGEFILARQLYNHLWYDLQLKRVNVWIITLNSGVSMIKEIKEQKKNGNIVCHSWNPMFDDFELQLNDIKLLFYFKEKRTINLNK